MTYGTNAPLGMQAFRYLNGATFNGASNAYPITSGYATGLFQFDPVISLSDGTIGIGVAGSVCRGVFMGVKYTQSDGTFKFNNQWPASTTVQTGSTIQALIMDDPNVVFDMQETNGSAAAGTPLALADRGLNLNLYVPTGSTSTGNSLCTINNATENTTATLNMKLIDLSPVPGNVVGSFANWLVTWNTHELKSVGTTGV